MFYLLLVFEKWHCSVLLLKQTGVVCFAAVAAAFLLYLPVSLIFHFFETQETQGEGNVHTGTAEDLLVFLTA